MPGTTISPFRPITPLPASLDSREQALRKARSFKGEPIQEDGQAHTPRMGGACTPDSGWR